MKPRAQDAGIGRVETSPERKRRTPLRSPAGSRCHRGLHSGLRRSFSLAEMMIALALLAMGLLVIGAALPIGIRYTRDSVDMATGDAAGQYALKVIEQSVCLFDKILDPATNGLIREPGLFQPRQTNPPDVAYPLRVLGEFIPEYVPVIKVRPLFARSIQATPGSAPVEWDLPPVGQVLVEEYARTWLLGSGLPTGAQECDPTVAQAGPWLRPALSSVSFVYPPITPDATCLPTGLPTSFLTNPPNNMYMARAVAGPPNGAETTKARERRVSWTGFYRRVGYGQNSDPKLYEFIVVVTRLPSERHRFPVERSAVAGGPVVMMGRSGSSSYASGQDTATPIPWLVTFAALPPLQNPAPATLSFTCTIDADGLFPVGTIFIPARNDDNDNNDGVDNGPTALIASGALRVGFGPPATTVLPIYEVTERPDAITVVTKFNGYYPAQMDSAGIYSTPAATDWPVWVIPPAFERLDGPGNPVFSDRSPVVAVARRYIRLREVP